MNGPALTRIGAALIALVIIAAACSSTPKSEPPPGLAIMANAAPGGVNSQIAEWLAEEIPDLEKQLGVTITFLPAGINDQDYKARVALDIKSGLAADVILLDQFWVPEFAQAGFIAPLDQHFQTWPGRQRLFPPIQQMGAFRGHAYMAVWNADLRMIFYNQDLFAQAGIETPWQPRSWQDLIDAARKIKAARPGVIPLQLNAGTAMDEAATMQGFFMVFLGAGGKLYDPDRDAWIVDSPALRRTMDFYRQIYVIEKLADARLQLDAKGREKSFELMSRQKIAIYVESTWFFNSVLNPSNPAWGMAERDRVIGWAKMPGGGRPGDPPFVSISGGDGLIVNPHSKNPELAWRLIAALNQLDRQERLFLKKPFTPTRDDLAALPQVAQHDFIAQTAREIMPYTSFRPALPEYPEISFLLQYLTERVITAQLPPGQAIAEFARSVESLVGKDRVMRE